MVQMENSQKAERGEPFGQGEGVKRQYWRTAAHQVVACVDTLLVVGRPPGRWPDLLPPAYCKAWRSAAAPAQGHSGTAASNKAARIIRLGRADTENMTASTLATANTSTGI